MSRRLLLAIVLGLVLLMGSIAGAVEGKWEIEGTMSGFVDPTGITFDGTWIWATEQHAGSPLYRINPETMTVEETRHVGFPSCCVQGLAWDGQYIWISGDGYEQYRYDPVTSELVHTCSRPSNPQAIGLTAVGDALYATGWYGGAPTDCDLMRFDPLPAAMM
jgi:hypothetical protein